MIQKYINIISLSLLIFLVSCKSINDAKHTLSEADSLRVEGVLYNDSAAISSAVEALTPFRHLYPTDYAKANYYYGRLLREHGNQAEAMRCFINALHVFSHDYNLLGKIYCNISIMCSLAQSDKLAYDMSEKSANCFLKAKNEIAYFYALNDMAYIKAANGEKAEALKIISEIEKSCNNDGVIIKSLENKSILYQICQKYDSAIYCVNQLQKKGYTEPTGMLVKAQSYSHQNNTDSAICYATQVMKYSNSPNDKYNALYILSHNDSTLNKDSILKLTSDREDIHNYEIDKRKIQFAKAMQILQYEMTAKPHIWRITFIVIITLSLLIVCAIALKAKHYRSKVIDETKQEIKKQTIIRKEQQFLEEKTNNLISQKVAIQKQLKLEIDANCAALVASKNFYKDFCWRNFEDMCDRANRLFMMLANKLKQKNTLSETEIRLCMLVIIGFNRNEISSILPYAKNSIGKLKNTTAKKLGTNGKELRDFLIKMAIG